MLSICALPIALFFQNPLLQEHHVLLRMPTLCTFHDGGRSNCLPCVKSGGKYTREELEATEWRRGGQAPPPGARGCCSACRFTAKGHLIEFFFVQQVGAVLKAMCGRWRYGEPALAHRTT